MSGRAVLLTEPAQIEPLVPAWRELACARGNPHLTPDFFGAWVESFGDAAEPFVPVLLDDDGRLRGLLPLVVTRDRLRQVQYAGGDFWMALELIARPGEEREVATALGRVLGEHGRAWRTILLDDVPVGSAWVEAFVAGVSGARRGRVEQRRERRPWLTVDLEGGYDAYLGRLRSKLRSEIRRIERRLHDAHDVQVRETTPERLSADLAETFRLHGMRREAMIGGSTYDAPPMRATMERFAVHALDQGWLRLRTMELDGEVAAANLFFRIGDRCVGYLLAWDPRWASIGLGRIVLLEGFRAAAEEGVTEFDQSVGHTELKARLATDEREVERVWVYPRSTALLFAAWRGARRAVPPGVRDAIARRVRSSAGRSDVPA